MPGTDAAPRNRKNRPNISEVAREAGVSIATVSRVVNGANTVAPDLADRVLDAVARLGYRPNSAARGLASGQTRTLGVIVPDLANPYFSQILKGIASAAVQHGYRTVVSDTDERPADEELLSRELFFEADGVVLCSARMDDTALERVANELGNRLVLVNRRHPKGLVSSVSIDAKAGMHSLAELLRKKGHERVCYLAGPPSSRSSRMRWAAVKEVFGNGAVSVPCGSAITSGYDATDAALRAGPTALMAFNDIVAMGAMARLRDLGLTLPDDMTVTGFDDIPAATHLHPALTTVTADTLDLGRSAWELLARQLSENASTTVMSHVPRLVERDSVAEPRRRSIVTS